LAGRISRSNNFLTEPRYLQCGSFAKSDVRDSRVKSRDTFVAALRSNPAFVPTVSGSCLIPQSIQNRRYLGVWTNTRELTNQLNHVLVAGVAVASGVVLPDLGDGVRTPRPMNPHRDFVRAFLHVYNL